MKRVTVKQIMSWGPCDRYPRSRVKKIIGNGVVLDDVWTLELDNPSDYLWLILRPEFLPENVLLETRKYFWERIAMPTMKSEITDEEIDAELRHVLKIIGLYIDFMQDVDHDKR